MEADIESVTESEISITVPSVAGAGLQVRVWVSGVEADSTGTYSVFPPIISAVSGQHSTHGGELLIYPLLLLLISIFVST